jgi:hypothetical protein
MHLLFKSRFGKEIKFLKHTHKWGSSSNPLTNPGKTFWIVNSNFRKHHFLQYLKMKYLFGSLNDIEMRCLFDAPGVLKDDLFVSARRAQLSGTDNKTLGNRLCSISLMLNKPRIDLYLYKQWGFCEYQLLEFSKPIRKPKKYSGYVRSPSSVGSKRRINSDLDPGIFEWSPVVQIDYYHALTVGDLILGESLVMHLPDDEPNRFETVKNNPMK